MLKRNHTMADAPPPTKTYRGNCHCTAFVYEITVPEIKQVSNCNCSVCTRKGYLWTIIADPAASFKVVKGDEDALSVYEFATKSLLHKVS